MMILKTVEYYFNLPTQCTRVFSKFVFSVKNVKQKGIFFKSFMQECEISQNYLNNFKRYLIQLNLNYEKKSRSNY